MATSRTYHTTTVRLIRPVVEIGKTSRSCKRFDQPELEAILRRNLKQYGAVTLRAGAEVTAPAWDQWQKLTGS
jgi:hypothetical protein